MVTIGIGGVPKERKNMTRYLRLVWENPTARCPAPAPADAVLRRALLDRYGGIVDEELPTDMRRLLGACERDGTADHLTRPGIRGSLTPARQAHPGR